MRRGELWWTTFDDVGVAVGREQAMRRPALIVSNDRINVSPLGLVIVIPLTRTDRGFPTHVPAGIPTPSFIMCEQVRSVSKARLVGRMFAVTPAVLAQVDDVLRILLAL